jgi:hypothetical protein
MNTEERGRVSPEEPLLTVAYLETPPAHIQTWNLKPQT